MRGNYILLYKFFNKEDLRLDFKVEEKIRNRSVEYREEGGKEILGKGNNLWWDCGGM